MTTNDSNSKRPAKLPGASRPRQRNAVRRRQTGFAGAVACPSVGIVVTGLILCCVDCAETRLLAQETKATSKGSRDGTPAKKQSAKQTSSAKPRRRPYRVAAEHILFLHAKSLNAGNEKRSADEALALAGKAYDSITRHQLDFHAACEKYSEDTVSHKNGGYMGIFQAREIAAEFEAIEMTIFGLQIGEVSKPVAPPLGVHLFRRVPIREWTGRHILIQFSGCDRAPQDLERTSRKARALAERVARKCREKNADFDALAREYSEAPDSVNGGDLGIFGPYEVLPALQRSIVQLQIGEIGTPVRTPLGWHVVRREAIRRAHVAHILIRFKGTLYDEGIERSREEALEHIKKIIEFARSPKTDFALLARQFSEDGSGAHGGSVGFVNEQRSFDSKFAQAALRLKLREISDVLETEYGFHILKRLEDE